MTTTYSPLDAFEPEFDSVFIVGPERAVTDAPGVYAPSVYHDETTDVYIDGSGWTPLSGYTGQHGYRGPVMHASEVFAGRLRDDVLTTPGTYVLVVVNVMPTEDDEDPEPAGWAVLRRDTPCRHCARAIVRDAEGRWIDPEATGDDSIWRETCDAHDTFVADHEPV